MIAECENIEKILKWQIENNTRFEISDPNLVEKRLFFSLSVAYISANTTNNTLIKLKSILPIGSSPNFTDI